VIFSSNAMDIRLDLPSRFCSESQMAAKSARSLNYTRRTHLECNVYGGLLSTILERDIATCGVSVRHCIKTNNRRIMRISLSGSSGNLVF